MHRFALFAIACIACGRVGFEDQAALVVDSGNGSGSVDAVGSGSGSGVDAAPNAGSFGTMQVGISTQNAGNDRMWISRFALTEPGNLLRLVAHFGPMGGQGANVRGVVYVDNNGSPAALIATTNEVTVTTASQTTWVVLELASPVPLQVGEYWIGTHSWGSIGLQYRTTVGATKFTTDSYTDGADATFAGGATTTTYAMELSVYAEYLR